MASNFSGYGLSQDSYSIFGCLKYIIFQPGSKGWQDGSKLPGHTLGNLTPADRPGSVQVIFTVIIIIIRL